MEIQKDRKQKEREREKYRNADKQKYRRTTEPPCCTPETDTTLQIDYTSINKQETVTG